MNLHEDREKLNQAVLLVAETLKMHPAIVEKDYFVTLYVMQYTRATNDQSYDLVEPSKQSTNSRILSHYADESCQPSSRP
jgi:hypothetical protein